MTEHTILRGITSPRLYSSTRPKVIVEEKYSFISACWHCTDYKRTKHYNHHGLPFLELLQDITIFTKFVKHTYSLIFIHNGNEWKTAKQTSLLVRSKHSSTMFYMTSSNASSLCFWMSFSAGPFRPRLMCLQGLSGVERCFSVLAKCERVSTASLLGFIISAGHAQLDSAKVGKQMAETQFCHTATVFSEDCKLLAQLHQRLHIRDNVIHCSYNLFTWTTI